MTLEFPFVKVDKMASVFGQIPNMREVIKACPPEFKNYQNPWNKLANYIFFHGLDFDISISAETREEADAKLQYLSTWLRSFDPEHEQKSAVGGWLLSLMLEDLPKYGGAK